MIRFLILCHVRETSCGMEPTHQQRQKVVPQRRRRSAICHISQSSNSVLPFNCLSVYSLYSFNSVKAETAKASEERATAYKQRGNGTERGMSAIWGVGGPALHAPASPVPVFLTSQCVPCQGCGCSCTDGGGAVGQETVLAGSRNPNGSP